MDVRVDIAKCQQSEWIEAHFLPDVMGTCKGCADDHRIFGTGRGGRSQYRSLMGTADVSTLQKTIQLEGDTSSGTDSLNFDEEFNLGRQGRRRATFVDKDGIVRTPTVCYCPPPGKDAFLMVLRRRINYLIEEGVLTQLEVIGVGNVGTDSTTRRPPALNFNPGESQLLGGDGGEPGYSRATTRLSRSQPSDVPPPTLLPVQPPTKNPTTSPTLPLESAAPSISPSDTLDAGSSAPSSAPSTSPSTVDGSSSPTVPVGSMSPTSEGSGTPTHVSSTPSVSPSGASEEDASAMPSTQPSTIEDLSAAPSSSESVESQSPSFLPSEASLEGSAVPSIMPSESVQDASQSPSSSPSTETSGVQDESQSPSANPSTNGDSQSPTQVDASQAPTQVDASQEPTQGDASQAPSGSQSPSISAAPTVECIEECCSDVDCTGEGEICFLFSGRCIDNGSLRFTLYWEGDDDLDLYVETPEGAILTFTNPLDPVTGGQVGEDTNQLELDRHSESTFFPESAPAGTYKFYQIPFNTRENADFWLMTVFVDGEAVRTESGTGLSDTFEFEFTKAT